MPSRITLAIPPQPTTATFINAAMRGLGTTGPRRTGDEPTRVRLTLRSTESAHDLAQRLADTQLAAVPVEDGKTVYVNRDYVAMIEDVAEREPEEEPES